MSILNFFRDDEDRSIRILSQHIPSGPAWEAKSRPESNFYKVLRGLVKELSRVEAQIQNVADEHDINKTVDLLPEWEASVGIPDSCFTTSGSLAQRRTNVILKLGRLNGTATNQDFVDIAEILGFEVEVISGSSFSLFPLAFPLSFVVSPTVARFTMRVQVNNAPPSGVFPIPFPLIFTGTNSNILECVFNILKPAVTVIDFVYIG